MQYLQRNGWNIYYHECFLRQVTYLANVVLQSQKANPQGWESTKEAKILAAIIKIIEENIPANPQNKEYQQGDTLGKKYKHWFRVKFFQRYRLFYRFSVKHKTIIIGWVNDTDTLRTYGAKNDAYNIFAKMLKKGNPPGNWDDLLNQAKKDTGSYSNPLFP